MSFVTPLNFRSLTRIRKKRIGFGQLCGNLRKMAFWIIIALCCGIVLFGTFVFIERRLLHKRLRKQGQKLLQTHLAHAETFHADQLNGLPKPVARYFRLVLKEGQPLIKKAYLWHTGKFRMRFGGNWMPIRGEEYFSATRPGFLWIGKTRWFTAVDSFMQQHGRLKIWLLGLFRVVVSRGPKIDVSELQRWLGEAVWFPTSLLPSEHLQWLPIDDKSAELVYLHNRYIIRYVVHFNPEGYIQKMETDRYYNGRKLKRWMAFLSDYKWLGDVMIPETVSAAWDLGHADGTYAVFHVDYIKYGY